MRINTIKNICVGLLIFIGFAGTTHAACTGGTYCTAGTLTCAITGDLTSAKYSAAITESQACTVGAEEVVTVSLPASSQTWTSGVSSTISKNTKVIGAGSGLDGTVLTGTGNMVLINPTVNAGISFELSDIRFVSPAASESNGLFAVTGQSKLINIHDNYFDLQLLAGGRGMSMSWANGTVTTAGVVHHNTFRIKAIGQGLALLPNVNFPPGPETVNWNDVDDIWYVEANTFIRDSGAESVFEFYRWAKAVFRYNDIFNGNVGGHGFDSDSGPPSLALVYNNKHTGNATNPGWGHGVRGGVLLDYGNTFDSTYTALMKIDAYRSCVATFGTPDSKSIESVNIDTDTITVTANGLTEGELIQFNDSLTGTAPSPIVASHSSSGTQYYAINVTENTFQVALTPTGSVINLTSTGTGNIRIFHGQCDGNNTYTDVWGVHDSNSDATGYRCMYLPGTTGTSGTDLMPLYQWSNYKDGVIISNWALNTSFTAPQCKALVTAADHLKENRDYFSSDTVNCPVRVDATTSCTMGIGIGTKAQRPDKCSNGAYAGSYPGPAWWATDEKQLYQCTAEDTWTSIYTEPSCPHPLAGSGSCGAAPGVDGYTLTSGETTTPVLTSATIEASGTTLTLVFSEAVDATINTGFTITPSSGPATLTYSSGSGTNTLVYTISRTLTQGASATLSYTQPGNGVESSDDATDLVSFTNAQVTNSSTQSNTTYTVTASNSAGCTVSPIGELSVVEGLTRTFQYALSSNYRFGSWSGTCGGSGTTTYTTDAVTENCTVELNCIKISSSATIGSGAPATIGSGAPATVY